MLIYFISKLKNNQKESRDEIKRQMMKPHKKTVQTNKEGNTSSKWK
jgi:hypothetical protein